MIKYIGIHIPAMMMGTETREYQGGDFGPLKGFVADMWGMRIKTQWRYQTQGPGYTNQFDSQLFGLSGPRVAWKRALASEE